MMERIEQECARIRERMSDPAITHELYCRYYAAQQALGWAANPEAAAAPIEVIEEGLLYPDGKIYPPMVYSPTDTEAS